MSYSSSASYRGNLGTLELEDGHLKFITRSGLVSQKNYVIQSIPLGAIKSMNAQGVNRLFAMIQKPVLVIVVDTSKMLGIPRHEFHLDAPEMWIAAIRDEMKVCDTQSTQATQPTYVKEVVREIVKYPCPYCNTLMEVTSTRCPSCGAPQKK